MPQIYRQHSEQVQRPAPEPRRRSSAALQATDADDSIVLSDIVRTGEASRLRRRGAMRLDHGYAPRLSAGNIPIPPPIPLSGAGSPATNPPRNLLPTRERAPILPWPSVEPAGDDEYPYSGEWRDWNADEGNAEGSGGAGAQEPRRDAGQDDDEEGYMLFCGGEEWGGSLTAHGSRAAFEPSPLPVRSAPGFVPPCGGSHAARRTNGCGAVVHMRAFPQRPRGVWVGKKEATEVVVGLDAAYFDRSVVAKMMKSACGCIREGIGCAECGNTLGTRYLPCQAASQGIFSRHDACPPPQPFVPIVPSGPQYWHSSSPSSAASNFYVYTFFADHVSSSPACTFPEPKRARAGSQGSATSRPASPMLPPMSYGYRWTVSPRSFSPYPLQPSTPSTASNSSPIFAPPPPPSVRPLQPRISPPAPAPAYARPLGLSIPGQSTAAASRTVADAAGARREALAGPEAGMELDPDGDVIAADAADEPSSPDKNEAMSWPGR